MIAYISQELRQLVIERAKGLCEYCQTAQSVVIEMEIDHVIPTASGGLTNADNLCLSCISCNSHKRDFENAIDPETGSTVKLFNPRSQSWNEHFAWDMNGTILVGLTAIGRATIVRLQTNREIAVEVRARWVQAGWHPPKK